MAASDQLDWYSSDENNNESRFSGRNSDLCSKIIGIGHTLNRDSDLESCDSDLEEEIQHDSDAETIIVDSYVTNRPGSFNNNIDSWTYILQDLPDILFVNVDNYGVTDRQSVVKFSIVEIFSMFFTDYILKYIVDQTNHYHQQCTTKHGFTHPEWYVVTIPELKTWLGLLLSMGMLQQIGCLSDYWSQEPVLATPILGLTMTSRSFFYKS